VRNHPKARRRKYIRFSYKSAAVQIYPFFLQKRGGASRPTLHAQSISPCRASTFDVEQREILSFAKSRYLGDLSGLTARYGRKTRIRRRHVTLVAFIPSPVNTWAVLFSGFFSIPTR